MKDGSAYQRQSTRRRTDGDKSKVSKAFSEAWKSGNTFAIVLSDDGAVRVKVGTRKVAYYEDASHFAADFFPELLG